MYSSLSRTLRSWLVYDSPIIYQLSIVLAKGEFSGVSALFCGSLSCLSIFHLSMLAESVPCTLLSYDSVTEGYVFYISFPAPVNYSCETKILVRLDRLRFCTMQLYL